jgi:hypothetical protein
MTTYSFVIWREDAFFIEAGRQGALFLGDYISKRWFLGT